jgi:hypothetical protein
MSDAAVLTTWEPPAFVPREECLQRSAQVLDRPDIPIVETEDVFRIRVHELDWDLGAMVYEPADPSAIRRGADGNKIGIFLLHGGTGDFRSMQGVARLYAGKFGCKVVSLTFPGRFYFDDPSHDWPGDSIHEDGSVRTPIWLRGENITRDQYDVLTDTSRRLRQGTRTFARAKPGTTFWNRMASWPVAFEEAMKDVLARHLPEGEFSIYASGHSTGGPYVFMISQRVPNIAGVLAAENSPFGAIQLKMRQWSSLHPKFEDIEAATPTDASLPPVKAGRDDRFNDLSIRTWRDRARYRGTEALGQLGPAAVLRLAWLMEDILDGWKKSRTRPQFKAEFPVTHNITDALRAAAEAVSARLGYSPEQTAELVEHYLGLPQPQTGTGVKPVPPVLFCVTQSSPDHFAEVYDAVVVPEFEALDPAPRVRVVNWGAGGHEYYRPEDDFPSGVAAPIVGLYLDAITSGYFAAGAR